MVHTVFTTCLDHIEPCYLITLYDALTIHPGMSYRVPRIKEIERSWNSPSTPQNMLWHYWTCVMCCVVYFTSFYISVTRLSCGEIVFKSIIVNNIDSYLRGYIYHFHVVQHSPNFCVWIDKIMVLNGFSFKRCIGHLNFYFS